MGEIDINSLVNLLINLWFKNGVGKGEIGWIDNIISFLKGLTWMYAWIKERFVKVAWIRE